MPTARGKIVCDLLTELKDDLWLCSWLGGEGEREELLPGVSLFVRLHCSRPIVGQVEGYRLTLDQSQSGKEGEKEWQPTEGGIHKLPLVVEVIAIDLVHHLTARDVSENGSEFRSQCSLL